MRRASTASLAHSSGRPLHRLVPYSWASFSIVCLLSVFCLSLSSPWTSRIPPLMVGMSADYPNRASLSVSLFLYNGNCYGRAGCAITTATGLHFTLVSVGAARANDAATIRGKTTVASAYTLTA